MAQLLCDYMHKCGDHAVWRLCAMPTMPTHFKCELVNTPQRITVKTLPGRNVTWSKRPRLGQNVHGHQVKTLPAIYVHYSVMNVISEWHSSTNVDP